MSFVSDLQANSKALGFDQVGWSKLSSPISLPIYRKWLDQGFHGTMNYLEDHYAIKENPQLRYPNARSAITLTKSYSPHPYSKNTSSGTLRVALYARGEDYHLHLKKDLDSLCEILRHKYPGEDFLSVTDSAPVLERDLAYKSGLGWIGKNTCLIHPENGSLFFLGEILTSLDLSQEKSPVADFCGNCDRCITACPTQAIESPRVLNATKCISYLTIESKTDPPLEYRTQIGDWFFGCDICQTVCPWNEKVFGKSQMQSLSQGRLTATSEQVEELKFILISSHRQIEERYKNSPVLRARPRGLKRNALVVIANLKLNQLKPEVERIQSLPQFEELATWCLAQLTEGESSDAKF